MTAAHRAFVAGMTRAIFIGSMLMFGAALLTLAILPAEVRRPADEEPAGEPSFAIVPVDGMQDQRS